ncbi:MAG: type I-C CRISPR-associated protein Cas5c [Mobilitalea sp.]
MKENSIEFKVYGRYALFSDPVTRVGGEKFSYQIPTYQALKGIVESIYWKPTLLWVIDRVRVIKPIQTQSQGIRPINYAGGNTLSIYTYLKDVEYQVKAHFEWNENRPNLMEDRNENKHHNIAKRMVEKGGRRDIFLGTRECQAYVEGCEFGSGEGAYDTIDELNFGLMLHGISYADEARDEMEKEHMTVRFWTPIMKNGIIEFIRPEECTLVRDAGKMNVKFFGDGNFVGADEFTEEGDVIGMDERTL